MSTLRSIYPLIKALLFNIRATGFTRDTLKKRKEMLSDKINRIRFRHVIESANVGTWDSLAIAMSKISEKHSARVMRCSYRVSNSYKTPSRDLLLTPIAFAASHSEEQWHVGFRFAPSSSSSHFLLSPLRSTLRSPLRLRNSCSHWITPTFTTLSASTISSLSSSTLHGMFRFCCIFTCFYFLLDFYSFWSVTFALTLFYISLLLISCCDFVSVLMPSF